jgi:hypothetical protein
VHFYANSFPSSPLIAGPSTATAVYTTVISNLGSGYNSSSGVFSVPVSGAYTFSYSILFTSPGKGYSVLKCSNPARYNSAGNAAGLVLEIILDPSISAGVLASSTVPFAVGITSTMGTIFHLHRRFDRCFNDVLHQPEMDTPHGRRRLFASHWCASTSAAHCCCDSLSQAAAATNALPSLSCPRRQRAPSDVTGARLEDISCFLR